MQTLQRSVGKKAVNRQHDVRTVQVLLNKNNSKIAPLALLVEDGDTGCRFVEMSNIVMRISAMTIPTEYNRSFRYLLFMKPPIGVVC